MNVKSEYLPFRSGAFFPIKDEVEDGGATLGAMFSCASFFGSGLELVGANDCLARLIVHRGHFFEIQALRINQNSCMCTTQARKQLVHIHNNNTNTTNNNTNRLDR